MTSFKITARKMPGQPVRRALVVAVMTAFASLSPTAFAQETAAPAKPATEEEAKTLSAITVTAQKREEQLQNVPIALTTLSRRLLQDTGVRDVKDLQVLVPGLTVTSTQSEAQTTARIRGVGTVGDNAGLESSVGIVIDGVYRPRNGVGFGDLGEIVQIDVLKGPQGTVFGKNTSAGVINVITRRPQFNTTVEGEITAGNYNAFGVSTAFNTTMGDNSALRIYAAKRKRDGFMTVRTGGGPRTQTDDYDQNFDSLRGQWLIQPNENLDINFSADSTSRQENCCTAATLVRGSTAAIIDALAPDSGLANPANPFARVAYSNRGTAQDLRDKGASAEVNWTTPWFGGAKLTSITASRDWKSIQGIDLDFSTADVWYRNADPNESFTGFKTLSQEFRLTGATAKVDWMVGAFYSDEDLKRNDSYRLGPAYEPYISTLVFSSVAPAVLGLGLPINTANPSTFLSQVSGQPFGSGFTGLGALDRYQQEAKSLAVFTNNTWRVTDAFNLTMGLRYTMENKQLDSVYSNPNGSPGCAAVLANPAARIAAALVARGVPLGALTPAQQAALLGGLAPGVVGAMCLPWTNALHNGRVTNQERDESEWSGTLKAAYRWNPNIMTYVSAARGYKAGGFNLDRVQTSNGLSSGGTGITPVNDTSFPGEFVNSYELGAKTTWAGGDLLLNATLFHQTYSNFQLNSFLGTSFVVRSIPKVISKGIDTELMWQPVKGLVLQGGITFADTRYGNEMPTADFVGPAGHLYKLPGSRASFAPLWSASGSVTYQWDFSDNLIGRFNLGAKYMSDYNTGSDLDAEKNQQAYTVVNARLGLGARDKHWMVELWGQNIFNKDYIQVGFDAPLQAPGTSNPGNPQNTYNAFLGAPATYGVTLRLAF